MLEEEDAGVFAGINGVDGYVHDPFERGVDGRGRTESTGDCREVSGRRRLRRSWWRSGGEREPGAPWPDLDPVTKTGTSKRH